MGKKPNGSGTIRKLPNGKFFARVSIKTDDPDKTDRLSKTFERQREAQRWINEITTLNRAGTCVDPSSMLLGDWWDTWVDVYKSKTVKPKTLETYKYSRMRLSSAFLKKPLKDVTRADVQREWNRIAEDHSRRTVELTRAALNACLSQAVEEPLIIANPASGTKLPPPIRKRVKPAADEALAIILAGAFAEPKMLAGGKPNLTDITQKAKFEACAFIALGGDRISECINSKWSDWDPANPGEIHVPGTKTIKSDRVIAVSEPAQRILFRRKESKIISEYIFCDRFGRPFLRNTLYHFCKQKTGYSVHQLRHAFATIAIRAGVGIRTVQEQLGHANIKTTLQMYVDVNMEDMTEAAKAVSDAMFKAFETAPVTNALPTQITNIGN